MNSTDLLFKALADPGCRQLMDELYANDGQTLSELCKHLEIPRQAVTQHLRILESANLIAINWQGHEKVHFLNHMPIHEVYEHWLKKFERQWRSGIHDPRRRFDDEDG